MGKKTRQEKIIADLRRKLKTTGVAWEQLPSPPPEEKKQAFRPESASQPTPYQSQSIYIYQPQLIKKDLTKTLALTILAVSLEIGMYLFLK
ncbi:hypothetical protein FJZ40_04275 [Candidatus Shapirobacteria bacterium]|nr:hypothetical protein [Candidatus Shapirobacteria bacterium]